MREDQARRLRLIHSHDGFRATLPLQRRVWFDLLIGTLSMLAPLCALYIGVVTGVAWVWTALILLVGWALLYGVYARQPSELSLSVGPRFLVFQVNGRAVRRFGRDEVLKVWFDLSDGCDLRIQAVTELVCFDGLDVDNPRSLGPRTRDYQTLGALLQKATRGPDMGEEEDVPSELATLARGSCSQTS